MRKHVFGGWLAAVILALSLAPRADAAVVFSNLDPDDDFAGTAAAQLGTGLGSSDFFYEAAMAFMPPGAEDFTLDRIELAVGLHSGSNELDVFLYNDNAGVPGDLLESFHFSDAMQLFGSTALLAADSSLHPTLAGGSQYWLSALPSDVNTGAGWNANALGQSGYQALFDYAGGGTWVPDDGQSTQGAYRISGSELPFPAPPGVVPEPSAFLLFGAGLAGLAGFRGRSRSS